MNINSKVVSLFPGASRLELVEPRERHAAALQQCIAAIAEEAREGGFPLTEQVLGLAVAILADEKRDGALPDILHMLSSPAE